MSPDASSSAISVRTKKGIGRSHLLARLLIEQLRGTTSHQAIFEYRFSPPRRWRFDVAFPSALVAVELQGGVWIQGRHARGAGITSDAEKFSEACAQGWRVLPVTLDMVEDGRAAAFVARALSLSPVPMRPDDSRQGPFDLPVR